MNMSGNYVEDKYRCNHPESDFVSNSKGPIEIVQDKNFVEYTRRNETANYRYDVWNRPSTSATFNSNSTSTNPYSSYTKPTYSNINTTGTTGNYSSSNSYNKNTTKKSNGSIVWIILFIYFGIPIIFSILGAILDAIF